MKTKIFLFFTIIFIVFSCKTEIKEKKSNNYSLENFLSLYRDIPFDTLHIHSNVDNYDDNKYLFKGNEIDSSFFIFFPNNMLNNLDNKLYACYKFKINNNFIGLITRTFSEYTYSSNKLFILNKNTKKSVYAFELSESWGDAGDSYVCNSWIMKSKENQFNILSKIQNCWYEDDNSTQSCIDSLTLSTLNNDKFKIIKTDSLILKALIKKLKTN